VGRDRVGPGAGGTGAPETSGPPVDPGSDRDERLVGGGPEIVLIAALAEENRVIGRDGDLPWHLPEDLKRFKRLTTGHSVLMGRKTFESIVDRLGGPLPDRRSVVLTSGSGLYDHPDVVLCGSLEEALEAVEDQDVVFVAGGASVYAQTLPLAHRLELTLVEGAWEGDAEFPAYEHLVGSDFEVGTERPGDGYRFLTLERVG